MDTKKVGDLADRHKAELERRANAQEEEQAEHRRAQANMQQMVTEPWNVLGQELKEFEKAYNDQFETQGIYVETYPHRIAACAGTQKLEIRLDRQTGHLGGEIGHEPLDLHMRAAVGEPKMVWVFEGAAPAEPADIALALGNRLTALAAGIPRDEVST